MVACFGNAPDDVEIKRVFKVFLLIGRQHNANGPQGFSAFGGIFATHRLVAELLHRFAYPFLRLF